MTSADARTKVEYVQGLAESLRTSPREAELWVHVGDLLLETGQFERAVRAYDMALLLDRKLHRAKIGLAVALDLSEADLSNRPPPRMRSTVWEVLQTLEMIVRGLAEGRWSMFVDVHALRLRKQVDRRLAANADDPDALFLRAAFLAREGRFEDAMHCLDRLGRVAPEHPGAAEFRSRLEALGRASAPRIAKPRK